MKIHLPEQGSNETTVKEQMVSTYNYRQYQISIGKWTTIQILKKYPRFRDYQNLVLFYAITVKNDSENHLFSEPI